MIQKIVRWSCALTGMAIMLVGYAAIVLGLVGIVMLTRDDYGQAVAVILFLGGILIAYLGTTLFKQVKPIGQRIATIASRLTTTLRRHNYLVSLA